MNVTDFPFDDLEDYDFTGYVVPNGASLIQCEEEGVYKPETKTGLFCDLLQIGNCIIRNMCVFNLCLLSWQAQV